jgi:hypothetical protein
MDLIPGKRLVMEDLVLYIKVDYLFIFNEKQSSFMVSSGPSQQLILKKNI